MIRLPASLEKKLTALFPSAKERDKFVARAVEESLKTANIADETLPEMVGGTIHLFTDGGSRGNPGQAAVGCVLIDQARGEIIREHAERIGIETNNVAEYRALIEGLKLATRYHPRTLVCHLGSELIVKQLSGEYRVRMPTLQPLVEEIQELSQKFSAISFRHIPRKDNWRADALVNKALDEHPSPHFENPR